jgi:hypothetical protein
MIHIIMLMLSLRKLYECHLFITTARKGLSENNFNKILNISAVNKEKEKYAEFQNADSLINSQVP